MQLHFLVNKLLQSSHPVGDSPQGVLVKSSLLTICVLCYLLRGYFYLNLLRQSNRQICRWHRQTNTNKHNFEGKVQPKNASVQVIQKFRL